MVDRLAMIKTNLESLLANESNILNVSDYEWLIAEVERLRGAPTVTTTNSAADTTWITTKYTEGLRAEVVALRTALAANSEALKGWERLDDICNDDGATEDDIDLTFEAVWAKRDEALALALWLLGGDE